MKLSAPLPLPPLLPLPFLTLLPLPFPPSPPSPPLTSPPFALSTLTPFTPPPPPPFALFPARSASSGRWCAPGATRRFREGRGRGTTAHGRESRSWTSCRTSAVPHSFPPQCSCTHPLHTREHTELGVGCVMGLEDCGGGFSWPWPQSRGPPWAAVAVCVLCCPRGTAERGGKGFMRSRYVYAAFGGVLCVMYVAFHSASSQPRVSCVLLNNGREKHKHRYMQKHAKGTQR